MVASGHLPRHTGRDLDMRPYRDAVTAQAIGEHLPKSLGKQAAACAWILFVVVSLTFAQTAPVATAPSAASQPDAIGLRAVVVEVHGMVQIRANARAPWQTAGQGMEAGEGAEFRTGPHSSITCVIPPDQTFTLDRLGVVKVAEAIQRGNK